MKRACGLFTHENSYYHYLSLSLSLREGVKDGREDIQNHLFLFLSPRSDRSICSVIHFNLSLGRSVSPRLQRPSIRILIINSRRKM